MTTAGGRTGPTSCSPDWLQLHGRETPERVAAISASDRPAGDEGDRRRRRPAISQQIAAYRSVADRILLDAKPPTGAALPGGQRRAVRLDACSPASTPACRFMLSGGLDPANVARGHRASTRPPGVDVSSGVEARAGRQGSRPDRGLRRGRPGGGRRNEYEHAAEGRPGMNAPHQNPNSFRTGPDENGHFGHVRRPLRRRDADAADPRAGAGLRRAPRPTRPSTPRWTAT